MKVAISNSDDVMTIRWRDYLSSLGIPYELLDFYEPDIIHKINDCEFVLWHYHQGNPKDLIFAKQLLYSLQVSGKRVFPDFHTSWHFDDKVGQKYLLESVNAPLVPTWIFYDKREAFRWVNQAVFPIVFKLRGGAGSQNVRLVKSKSEAKRLIRIAFGHGFPSFNPMSSLKERLRKYREGKGDLLNILVGLARFIFPPLFSRYRGRERGYIYFQEFLPGNDHDIRVIVIGDKAFALKRMVRKNDFRASGSGYIVYDRSQFPDNIIDLSFKIATKLKTQCVAFDFIYRGEQPLITEISYGFSPHAYDYCPGYWDKNLVWHEGKFNPYGWIIDDLLEIS
jgi:glutathione synthase/RimK-type ligase-like ATP-grasp enzyme